MIDSGTYGWLDRQLHWLALEPGLVRRITFDIESSWRERHRERGPEPVSTRPVYVCGLARSGTTVLMRALERLPEFHSLKYKDMPFVLAPGLWNLIGGRFRKTMSPRQRAHGDGLMVNTESPEAFEEVFWKTFSTRLADRNRLGYEPPSAELMAQFATFRSMVLHARGATASGRYLSKNNNNLLRLPALVSEKDAHVLLAYRHPLGTAVSLHRQHQQFKEMQRRDDFVLKYMNWLGHFEFGQGHLPFCMAVDHLASYSTPDDLDYWLAYWISIHEFLLGQPDLRLSLVNHESLCAAPTPMLASILDTVGARKQDLEDAGELRPSSPLPKEAFSAPLVERAQHVFRRFLDDPRNVRREHQI